MFKEFIAKLNKLGERKPVDPSVFEDPMATKTAWTPVKSGGANFRTHRLTSAASYRLEFKATLGTWLFGVPT